MEESDTVHELGQDRIGVGMPKQRRLTWMLLVHPLREPFAWLLLAVILGHCRHAAPRTLYYLQKSAILPRHTRIV